MTLKRHAKLTQVEQRGSLEDAGGKSNVATVSIAAVKCCVDIYFNECRANI